MKIRNLSKALLFSLLSVAIGTLPALGKEFKFTAIPDQNTAHLEKRFAKIATYLSQQLGTQVRYVPVKSYAASVAAFKNNEVQLAWFGGLSGVKARLAVPGSPAIAQGEEDEHFVTYFIANTSTGLSFKTTFPQEIAGRTFTFGSKGSTSGRLMPEFYLREYFHKAPEKIFKRVGFSGDHSKTIALVQSGSYEVGAVNFKVWERAVGEGRIDPKKVTVIWATPEYPDYNWTIRGDVEKHYGEGFIQKVQRALIDLNDPDVLASFPRRRFIKADNSIYQPILSTGMAIGVFRK